MLVSLPIARTIISVVLMLASACSALAQPAPIGLVIGNGSYAAFPALSACVESSQDIANTLRGLGYRIVERQDVTSGGMAAAIGELSTDMEATPAASVFVYICGYAAGMNERPFLLPVSAVRTYTAKEIAPLPAEQSKLRFLPHTVPSWAAQTNMRNQLEPLPSYTYKEASLNPTNPADRATDWEADIIGAFTRNQELTEFVSTRESALGPTLSLSKPIRLKDPACLSCHSTPAAAPATLIDLYGAANGFGWKLNEVVGVQVMTVPLQIALDRANTTLKLTLGGLAVVFLVVIALLNVLLATLIVRPVRRMSLVADEISTGNMSAQEIEPKGHDEIASLGTSFNRMRRSLENAMKMLEG